MYNTHMEVTDMLRDRQKRQQWFTNNRCRDSLLQLHVHPTQPDFDNVAILYKHKYLWRTKGSKVYINTCKQTSRKFTCSPLLFKNFFFKDKSNNGLNITFDLIALLNNSLVLIGGLYFKSCVSETDF